MKKYMIGDEFGNMYYEESDDFFSDKGTLYTSKVFAKRKLEEISKRQEYLNCDWEFKIWIISMS